MFERILVPVDHSPFSEAALDTAVSIAKQAHATIHLVTVRAGMSSVQAQPAAVVLEPDIDQILDRQAHTYVDALARTTAAAHGIDVVPVVLEGMVARAIARYIRRKRIDLVVMTTHGRGGFRRAWLGSVADGLIRRLGVPLLLIRPLDSTRPPSFTTFARPLVAVDGSEIAELAAERAPGLPFTEDAKCALVRVAPIPWIPPDPGVIETIQINESVMTARIAEAERYLERLAPRLAADWNSIDVFAIGGFNIADAILAQARTLAADLIVIGTHGSGLRRAVIGSVADKVIRGADVPVFVVPARALSSRRRAESAPGSVMEPIAF